MLLEILNILAFFSVLFCLYKAVYGYSKLPKKAIVLYTVLFLVIGISSTFITVLLALSGTMPNHYVAEYDYKLVNDISLFSGIAAILLSFIGLVFVLIKLMRRKNLG